VSGRRGKSTLISAVFILLVGPYFSIFGSNCTSASEILYSDIVLLSLTDMEAQRADGRMPSSFGPFWDLGAQEAMDAFTATKAKISESIRIGSKEAFNNDDLKEIIHNENYVVQMVRMYEKNQRIVYINGICSGIWKNQPAEIVQRRLLVVYDHRGCSFDIEYDPVARKIVGHSVSNELQP
jgi:hypothetical protein